MKDSKGKKMQYKFSSYIVIVKQIWLFKLKFSIVAFCSSFYPRSKKHINGKSWWYDYIYTSMVITIMQDRHVQIGDEKMCIKMHGFLASIQLDYQGHNGILTCYSKLNIKEKDRRLKQYHRESFVK